MSAADELQRDVLEALADDATLLTITVDFARRVLAEMDAALATLAEVRELRDEYRGYLDSGQNQDDPVGIGPLLSAKGVVHALTEILDRSKS